MSTDRASGLLGVQNNLPDNTQRLITEEIMRNELSKIWNSNANLIDDEFRFNVREYQDRAYKEGEGSFFNGELYQANEDLTGGAFDPAKWTKVGGSGVTSFNTRQGNVSPASGDYDSDQITNKSTKAQGSNVTEALDYLYDLATQGAINSFFVNSNNPNSGDGSISNPFNSLDLAFNTIVGNGTPANPELAPIGTEIGIVVQGGSYSTSQNLLIRRCSWVFELGAVVDYAGTGALFDMDSSVFGNPSSELIEFFILGDGEFTTSTGSFFTSSMGNLNGGGRLTFRGIRFQSNVINPDPHSAVLFDLDNNSDTAYQYASNLIMPLDTETIIYSLTQTVFKLGNKTANSGRKGVLISNALVSMGSQSAQGTQSVDARCVNIHRGHGVRFTNCLFTGYKNEYQIELSGVYRSIRFQNSRASTTSNSNGVKSVGAVRIQDDFVPNSDGGGSSAILICEFDKFSVSDNNFTSNELITYTGTGDIETILLRDCFLSGGISDKIKVAKSISFTGNGSNPSSVTVYNVIDKKVRISNLEEDSQVTRQVFADEDGNLFFQIGSSSGNSFQFGINENGGVVELGGQASGKSLSIWSDSSDQNKPLPQDLVFGYDLSDIFTNDIFTTDKAFRSFTVVTDPQGNSEIANATDVGDLVSYLTLMSRAYDTAGTQGRSLASFLSSDPQTIRLSTIEDTDTSFVNNRANVGTRSQNNLAEAFVELFRTDGGSGSFRMKQGSSPSEIITELLSSYLELSQVLQNDNNTKVLSLNPVTNRVEWIDKSTIGGGSGNGKEVIKYEFVKSGNVTAQVSLETHSSFANSTPIQLPSGITSAKIIGFNFLSSTSVATQGTTASFEIRTQNRNNHIQRPFGGGVLRYTNTQLSVGGAQGTRYYESVRDGNLINNPVTIDTEDLVFVDLTPQFWQLTDVNVHVFIEIEY